MKLFTFFASSGAYRVRIALALKNLDVEMMTVNLTKGEHRTEKYGVINPMHAIPSLIDNHGNILTQSLAIIEYLDELYPAESPLMPSTPLERARVRAISQAMAGDIAPLNNLQIRKYIKEQFRADEKTWIQHWTKQGLTSLEAMLANSAMTGRFCHGDTPTMADCVLVPQLFHARRFECDLSPYPTLLRIDAHCAQLPAFTAAHPSRQPDAA